ncbi:hypothetical protein BH23CHL1_BH23CHL1_15220 [soil metagenome]|jgi:hypothetical protein
MAAILSTIEIRGGEQRELSCGGRTAALSGHSYFTAST